LPQTPFIIDSISVNTKNAYLISKFKERYILTAIDSGRSYDMNYTNEYIINKLNEGTWELKKSQLVIE